ncbi:protein At-4/1 isoform X1 [Apium graveolens]|uniref:protein At-4/1 isoform X1 n=1 Tax=Apium graveolens TaxID=4045 RepID=UPI003D7B3109
MAANKDFDSILSDFDKIYDDCKKRAEEVQSLQSYCNAEVKRREALQFNLVSLKSENERLAKLYTDCLNKMVDQVERGCNFQRLKEEENRLRDESVRKENEHMNTIEFLKQEYAARITDMETQIRACLIQKTSNEATIVQLHQDLAAHRKHIETLSTRLERVHLDVDLKYQNENQDLRDCLSIEQEEKNELNRRLQDIEKELLVSKAKLGEQQQDLTSSRNVETLKQKIMKLRKENEVLKRQLSMLKEN